MSTLRTLRTIVVATDVSENAAVALAWAEALARQHDATLVLVHASTLEPPAASEFVQWPQEYNDGIRARVKSALDRQAESARTSGITVDCELGFGAAVDVVVAAAERRRADILVAGTRGRTGLKRLRLGNTAARLIRHARCPVLTVHPTNAGFPRPVCTVLVPTEFSEDAALAAEAATPLLGASGADRRLVLLHAYHVPYEGTHLPEAGLLDAISAADASVKQRIEEAAANVRASGIRIDTVTWEGDPPEVILRQAKSVGADIIAMGMQGLSALKRLLLGSTTERFVASAPCPVLTVRHGSP